MRTSRFFKVCYITNRQLKANHLNSNPVSISVRFHVLGYRFALARAFPPLFASFDKRFPAADSALERFEYTGYHPPPPRAAWGTGSRASS